MRLPLVAGEDPSPTQHVFATATSVLSDRDGEVGRGAQALVVRAR